MAQKLASAPASAEPQLSQLARMLHSLDGPLAPEARRVMAAARVGLKLLETRAHESGIPQLHVRRQALRARSGGAPLREENLPGSIQEMLARYRELEALHAD